MGDRERTIFAAAEAIFGAGLVIVGGLLLAHTGGVGDAIGLATFVLGAIAVAQAVLVGLGLARIYERRGEPDRDD
jgi:membrane protein implicated in regulation of membrane protease activity